MNMLIENAGPSLERKTAPRGDRRSRPRPMWLVVLAPLLLGMGCGPMEEDDTIVVGTPQMLLGPAAAGPVHHRIPVYFILMTPDASTSPPITITRAAELVGWANEVFYTADVQFYVQGIKDVVMPNFADVPNKNAEVPWSQVWQELSQVATVTASTYPSDRKEELGDWLELMYTKMPRNRANVWVATGAGMWNAASRLGSAILVRKDIQEDNKYNFAHELGHFLNLVHTHVDSSTALVSYPTPPLLDDDPDDPCILWDTVYVRNSAPENPLGRNMFFSSRADCESKRDSNGIPRGRFRSMLPNGSATQCPAACVANHSDPSCGDIVDLCWYEANSSTNEVGRSLHGEWYEGEDTVPGSTFRPLHRGVSRQATGSTQWAYNLMAYSGTHSWNNLRYLSDSGREIVRDTSFRYRHRPQMTCMGQTDPDDTDWVQYNADGVYVDVDTSLCGLETPLYFSALGGDSQHWYSTGVTSIYSPTDEGFRVYVNRPGITVAEARSNRWHVNWTAHPKDARGSEVCTGNTGASSNWKAYSDNGVYLDVDTSACDFAATPVYVTSLGGQTRHWEARGATSIYSPTPTGFRVYVQLDGLTVANAKSWEWQINWKAVPVRQPFLGGCSGKSAPADWQPYASDGVYVDVAIGVRCSIFLNKRDVLNVGTTTQMTPFVFTSLAGDALHWQTRGATSIYSLTSTGFRVYVQRPGITPAQAEANGWYINWLLQP